MSGDRLDEIARAARARAANGQPPTWNVDADPDAELEAARRKARAVFAKPPETNGRATGPLGIERGSDLDATRAAIPKAEQPKERRVVLVLASTIPPVETTYTVFPYIPEGEITWFEGDSKAGKTFAACSLVATITKGGTFNGEAVARGKVAILTCEDDPARSIIPRLIAADADLLRVSIVKVKDGDEEQLPSFLTDLPAIEASFAENGVTFALIDGTFGFLGAKDGGKSYTDAYSVMLPFVAMARRLSIGCVAVRHVRKSEGSALAKGIGSVGFGALARSTVSVSVDQRDEGRRLFAHAGVNTADVGATLAFRVDGVMLPGFERSVGRVTWLGPVEVTADEAVAAKSQEEATERENASDWLLEFLAGPTPSAVVRDAAKKAGIADRTLRRAAHKAGVHIERHGYGGGATWYPPGTFSGESPGVAGSLSLPHSGQNLHSGQANICGRNAGTWPERTTQADDDGREEPLDDGRGVVL
ncbi:MAG: AAA family ATPase [Candidatus Baltobacteraceae bacterium]